ncbi:L-methionine gamma-lyase-like [Branchiostoma floridae x Branchiostoma japonicum]
MASSTDSHGSSPPDDLHFDTLAVMARPPAVSTRPIAPSIETTSTYVMDTVDEYVHKLENKGYIYSRHGGPTQDGAAYSINQLEGGYGTLVFSSGMAAVSTVLLSLLKGGDHVICQMPVYAGTMKFLQRAMLKFDVEVTWVKAGSVEEFAKNIKDNTKLLWGESPANPLCTILDLEEFGRLGQTREGLITVVDSTFAGPYHQQPLRHGVDVSMNSCTKYLGGHCDLLAGALSTSREHLFETFYTWQQMLGNNLSPFDAFLLHRGTQSLHVRMDRHSSNAMHLANFLQKHPKVERVFYPGLPSHPQHEVAKRVMGNGYSGMMSFEVKGGEQAGKTFVESVRVIKLAVSLGGVESLVEHPATMTHGRYMISDLERDMGDITPGLIRFSVGIENVQDLENDLAQALDKI